jgi:hypothetical protein
MTKNFGIAFKANPSRVNLSKQISGQAEGLLSDIF